MVLYYTSLITVTGTWYLVLLDLGMVPVHCPSTLGAPIGPRALP